MKTFSFHPTIYRTTNGKSSRDARAGDIVTVYGRKVTLGLEKVSLPIRIN